MIVKSKSRWQPVTSAALYFETSHLLEEPKLVFLLHGTPVNHLLPQVLLVFTNITLPSPNRLVLAHQNLLGNLIE